MLSRLGIDAFKSFARARIPFGNLSLMVGANASGKSNVRDALRVLHGVGLGYPLAEILGDKYGPGGILQWRGIRGGAREAAHADGQRFHLSAEITRPLAMKLRYTIGVDTSDERLGPRVFDERLTEVGGSYLFDSSPPDDPVEQRSDHELRVRLPRGGNHRKHGPLEDFPSTIPALCQFADRTNVPLAIRDACRDLRNVLQGLRFLDLDPDAMRQASAPGSKVLGDRGENLSSVLQSIAADENRKRDLVEWLSALTPMDAVDLKFRLDLQGRVLVYLVEGSGAETSAISASDGTLRFLALVAALLSPNTGRVYFFEELDNGIHPTRLHLLLDLMERACRSQGVQIIGTTHNPALLAFLSDQARDSALVVHRPEAGGPSEVRRIATLPRLNEILEERDLGALHVAGWLEDVAFFSEAAPEDVENLETRIARALGARAP